MEEIHKIDIEKTKKLFEQKLSEKPKDIIKIESNFKTLMELEETINKNLSYDTKTKVDLGGCLDRIKNFGLYKIKGYEKFDKYCENEIGITKSYSNILIHIYDFLYRQDVLSVDNCFNYSISQLQEMLPLTKEQLKLVSPEMTIKQIRELKGHCDCGHCCELDKENTQLKNRLIDFNVSCEDYDMDYFKNFDKSDLVAVVMFIYEELNRLRKNNKKGGK